MAIMKLFGFCFYLVSLALKQKELETMTEKAWDFIFIPLECSYDLIFSRITLPINYSDYYLNLIFFLDIFVFQALLYMFY